MDWGKWDGLLTVKLTSQKPVPNICNISVKNKETK